MKTVEQRLKDCIVLRQKLQELNVSHIVTVPQFVHDMNTFVKDGTDCIDRVFIPEMQRYMEYTLLSTVGTESKIMLTLKKRTGT
jgi:hypothetical protein